MGLWNMLNSWRRARPGRGLAVVLALGLVAFIAALGAADAQTRGPQMGQTASYNQYCTEAAAMEYVTAWMNGGDTAVAWFAGIASGECVELPYDRLSNIHDVIGPFLVENSTLEVWLAQVGTRENTGEGLYALLVLPLTTGA